MISERGRQVVVGFIGLGTMGGPMALNLRRAEYNLIVFDVRPTALEPHITAGASRAGGVRDIGERCDVVFSSLPRPEDVEAVADELIVSMRPGSAWFDLSTSSPALIRRLHCSFRAKNVDILDAPVSGGPRGAKTGKLALWVGGERAVFDRNLPLLHAIGDQVMHMGPVGAGLVAKLVNNCAHYMLQAAMAEAFTLGVKAGVDPLNLWSALRQGSSGRMRTFDRLGRHFLRGVFDPPDFALDLAQKDVRLAIQLAIEHEVPMRVGSLAYAELLEASRRGWGARDSRVAMLLQEERAGVQINLSAEDIDAVLRADE